MPRSDTLAAGDVSAVGVPRTVSRARLAVLASFVLNGFLFANWVARVPAVRDGLDLTSGRLGLLLLAMALGSVITLPTVGAVVLRVGTRRTVSVAGLLCASGLLTAGIGTGLELLPLVAIGLFAGGVGMAAWDVSMNIEGAAVERRLGRSVMPQFHAAFSIGAVAGSATGAAAALAGLPVPLHLLVVWVLCAVGVVLSARRFLPSALSQASPAPASTDEPPAKKTRSRALSAWTEPRTLLIGLLVLSAALTEGSAADWLAVSVVDGYGQANAVGALCFGLFVASMTVVRIGGTSLLDTFGRVLVLRVSASVSLVGLLLFGLAPVFWLGVIGVLAWGAGAALGFPVGMSAAADDASRAAVRVSVVSAIGYCAFLAGPPLLGFAADHLGNRHALLLIGIGLAASIVLAKVAAPLRHADENAPVAGDDELSDASC